MSQPTGYYDRDGIPIYVGDLIRVKHYRHVRKRRQMWLYFRVSTIAGRAVVQNWDDLDATKWQTGLATVCADAEVLAETGLQRNGRGELMTFNERPRKKHTTPATVANPPTSTDSRP